MYTHIALESISDITIHDESVTSSTFTLTWMEISLTSSDFRHYTIIYLPVSGPYGPIMTSNRRKRQSAQAGELTMNFTGTTGTLTNLYGAVIYRIQVVAVIMFNGQEVVGGRSTAIEMTTLEGSKQVCTCTHKCLLATYILTFMYIYSAYYSLKSKDHGYF